MMHQHTTPDCDSVLRQLWDYLDQELTETTMRTIEMHLEHCQNCRPQADYRRVFQAAVSSARTEAGDLERLRDRVRSALRAESGLGPER